MDVKAIILLPAAPADGRPAPDRFAGIPLALLDVFGRPLLAYTFDRLHASGLEAADIALIADLAPDHDEMTAHALRSLPMTYKRTSGAQMWQAAERQFEAFVESGADVILLIYASRYLELNYEDVIRFHLESRNRITCVEDVFGSAKVFAVNACRRNDAAFLLRHHMAASRVNGVSYHFGGYSVPLTRPRALRTIVVDAFAQKNALRPSGVEIKPGVWVGEGARIERGARLVAPVFIGAGAQVGSTALVTRASNVERCAKIDCGTVVEDSCVLPYAFVGAGLDVSRMVVGYSHIAHLDRNVQIEIRDQRLLDHHGLPVISSLRRRVKAASLWMKELAASWSMPAPSTDLQADIATISIRENDFVTTATPEEIWRPVGQ